MLKLNPLDVVTMAPESFTVSVDLAVLRSFESVQLDGEPDLIVELIDLYVEDAPRRLVAMRESLASRDWATFKREAHSLKGSSGNLGANQLALICGEMEALGPVVPFQDISALLDPLNLELEEVLHVFLEERQRRTL